MRTELAILAAMLAGMAWPVAMGTRPRTLVFVLLLFPPGGCPRPAGGRLPG
jgi:hypothetical protein